ncbi:copper homeostasis protein CutC [Granulicoccus sp. GXG6511]|uniref:copper homeostasis protein CutC n=1 Tax=Granulicoccus sp. GXG6511 TaxID=3381351 RepID=UPI003D7E56D0
MSALLEVLALHPADAQRAEEGGADRVQLVGSLTDAGMSPEPALVERVRDATTIQVRVLLRLRDGFGTDGGEVTRLRGLAASYVDAGADGIVMGFLNGHGDIDAEVLTAILSEGEWPWTCHRAIDHALDTDRSWRTLQTLPRLDQVLTAGSARDLEHGLDDLIARARADAATAALIQAGGDLRPEHVPWLVRAGVRSFHITSAARPLGSWKAYVDAGLVQAWRTLIDAETRHRPTTR